MSVSVIIIVKNDYRIFKLLDSLETIRIPKNTEILVVDASSKKITNKYKNIKWIYYTSKKNKRTYSEQRNLGIKNSKGSIIVFIDADCVPSRDWLINITEPIMTEKENIVSGAVKPFKKDYIHIEESYGKYRKEAETMNLAILRIVFKKVGLFDESLEGCEDSDFCIRAIQKGYKIKFEKNAVIYHDWGGFKKNVIRSYNGGKDRVKLYKKHTRYFDIKSANNIYTFFYLVCIMAIPLYFFYPYLSLIVFIPSIVKRRNPIKEIYNICFTFGLIKQSINYVL